MYGRIRPLSGVEGKVGKGLPVTQNPKSTADSTKTNVIINTLHVCTCRNVV